MNMFLFVCFMVTKSMPTVENGTNTVAKNAVYTNGSKGINMKEADPNDYETRCNVILTLWMDNILTDKQYYAIREKLDKFEEERRKSLLQ